MKLKPVVDWRNAVLPKEVKGPKTMLMDTELKMLYLLGKEYFKNEGHIIDAGCFLGGSTVAIGEGVKQNAAFRSNPKNKIIHSYDFFKVEPWTIGIYFDENTPLETSFEPIYRENINEIRSLVDINVGNVMKQSKFEAPIEILFIDIAKWWNVNDFMVKNFFTNLIPNHSIVIQQDYLFNAYTAWLHVTMEYFADYFEIIDHTERNSVLFAYKKRIPDSLLQKNIFQSLSFSEIIHLQKKATKRFDGLQKKIMQESGQNLIGLLLKHNWPGSEGYQPPSSIKAKIKKLLFG